jgi:hypothetical protein
MGSLGAVSLQRRILAGALTGTTLETELSTSINRADFKLLMSVKSMVRPIVEQSTALDILKNSTTAKSIIFESNGFLRAVNDSLQGSKNVCMDSQFLKECLNNENFFEAMKENNFRFWRNHLNRSYSKLKRKIITSSGTEAFTNNVIAYSLVLIGAGGSGSPLVSSSLAGGTGGEFKINVNNTGFSTGSYTATVGIGGDGTVSNGNGTDTIFLSTTSEGGQRGLDASTSTPPSGESGGVTSGRGKEGISDIDILNAIWQYETLSVKGAYGSFNPVTLFSNIKGENGLIGKGGQDYNRAGTGFCSGGGAGKNSPNSNGGENALDNTGCGGGSADQSASGSTVGKGGSGLIILHYIEA